jgi:hypothetical protein
MTEVTTTVFAPKKWFVAFMLALNWAVVFFVASLAIAVIVGDFLSSSHPGGAKRAFIVIVAGGTVVGTIIVFLISLRARILYSHRDSRLMVVNPWTSRSVDISTIISVETARFFSVLDRWSPKSRGYPMAVINVGKTGDAKRVKMVASLTPFRKTELTAFLEQLCLARGIPCELLIDPKSE